MELEKILTKKQVVHKKLGNGTVEEIQDGYLIIRFSDDKISKFAYPDAFEKFLSMTDDETQSMVDRHLRMRKLILAEQSRRKKQELQKIDDELKLHHKEELLKKQKAAMAKVAKEKRTKSKKVITV